MSRQVSIKTIAADLGISHMTVSRALMGHPNVRPETRAKIEQRAAELGYVKSAAANVMRGQSTAIVGLLAPNLINEFYARFANRLGTLCADNGLHLVIDLTNDDPDRERQSIRRLRQLQARAVITVPTPDGTPPDTGPNMRCITLIRSRNPSGAADELLIDDGASIGSAVELLASKGHRQIGYIGGPETLSSGRQRHRAFADALLLQGLGYEPGLIRLGPPSYQRGHQSALDLLDQAVRPSALLCGGFEISNGALDASLQLSLSFPDDLAFVGFGDPSAYRWINGGITTIGLPIDAMAEHTVELLLNSAGAPHTKRFVTTLVQRRSM